MVLFFSIPFAIVKQFITIITRLVFFILTEHGIVNCCYLCRQNKSFVVKKKHNVCCQEDVGQWQTVTMLKATVNFVKARKIFRALKNRKISDKLVNMLLNALLQALRRATNVPTIIIKATQIGR